jgi:two-component system, NarL family, response regulator DevR
MATRIVVCDDHPMFRTGLAAAIAEEPDLDLAGEAGSLAQLRRVVAETPTDLILLDVELPDGSGATSVGEFAARASVVMISAHDDPVLVRQTLHDGALGYIRKDAEPEEVLRLVRRAADGKTALSGDMALRVAEALRREPEQPAFVRNLESLSPRLREVVALIAEGRSNREIADHLYISEGTVKNYVTRILEALDVTDRTKLAILLVRHQLRPGGWVAG